MRSPAEEDEKRTGAHYLTQGERPPGKAFLRQREFLAQRGLAPEPRELAIAAPAVAPRTLTAASYRLGMQRKEELLAAAPAHPALVWRFLGPAGIPHGQTYGDGPGATATMSGRVPAIAVDPSDSDHLLVGSAAGGVWQTRDGGATWTPQADDQPTLSIGAIAFAPSDASIVYAATGEGNSAYSALGQGILVSHDGGSSWTVVGRDVFTGFGFYQLVVDPADPQRLLAATTGGAAESADGGATWSLLHSGLTWSVSLGSDGEVLLGARDGVFGSKPGAAPRRIHIAGLHTPLDAQSERIAVAHMPSDPGQAFVFAGARGHARLWSREAAGTGFTEIQLPFLRVAPNVKDVFNVQQAWYDWHLSIPPWADDTIYLGAIELVRGVRGHHGWKFEDISSRAHGGDSIHPDQHTMAFDATPGVLYAGNDGGIFRSRDRGDSWESLNAGLAISEVEFMAQRPDEPVWILAGLQDNGTIRREADGAWTQVALGDGGDCATDMDDPDVCFHSYYGMSLERSPHRADKDSWVGLEPPEGGDALFYPPVEVNGDVVAKAGDTVAISSDRGDTWSAVPLPARPDGRASLASAMAIPTTDRLLVGTILGDIFRIDRAHGDWGAPTALAATQEGWISDLAVHPAGGQRMWATFSNPGAVFRSDDDGATWANVTANLPKIPVNAVVGDPDDPDRVWVACDVGVFESSDAGGSWTVYGTGLPNALAEDLLFYAPERLLRVGTRSRGVWEISAG